MKNFEYAQKRNSKKRFKMPALKIGEKYSIPLPLIPLVPLWLGVIIYNEFHDWNYRRQEWSEEKATKVLNHFLPYVMEWNEEENSYFYCMDWHYGGSTLAKYSPIGLKTWARKYSYEIFRFLKDKYENPDFVKTIEDDYYEKWVKFEKRG